MQSNCISWGGVNKQRQSRAVLGSSFYGTFSQRPPWSSMRKVFISKYQTAFSLLLVGSWGYETLLPPTGSCTHFLLDWYFSHQRRSWKTATLDDFLEAGTRECGNKQCVFLFCLDQLVNPFRLFIFQFDVSMFKLYIPVSTQIGNSECLRKCGLPFGGSF